MNNKPRLPKYYSMTQAYSEYFTPIRKRLETLKGAIEQDMPGLEAAALDLTLRQVGDITSGLDSAISAYRTAMQPYYRVTRKSRTSTGQGGSGYYQRRREQEEQITKVAQDAIEKQGYVIEANVTAQTGYREGRVQKTLERLAQEKGWEKKRDRETKSYRYTSKTQVEPQLAKGDTRSG